MSKFVYFGETAVNLDHVVSLVPATMPTIGGFIPQVLVYTLKGLHDSCSLTEKKSEPEAFESAKLAINVALQVK